MIRSIALLTVLALVAAATSNTHGAAPNACELPVTATLIHDIQGSGMATGMAGSVVTIEGIVVGDYQAAGEFGGFHVQEEDADADGDPATSEGIFVFSTMAVASGDLVRVTGTVAEGFGLTQLTSILTVFVCGSRHSVAPIPVTLPVAAVSDFERNESMLISIAQDLTVTGTFTLGRFGEVDLSVGGRLDHPTGEVAPGAQAIALQNLHDRSRILLDDGNNEQNIDPTRFPDGGLSASNTLRSGSTLHGLTGVLDFRFGRYRVQPIGPITFDRTNPRPYAPEAVGGDVRVASVNVMNYFNGDGMGGGFPTERGANDEFEWQRQRNKIVSAIVALEADVVGLLEIENDATDGHSAIEDVVDGLNAATLGPGTWGFVDTGTLGADVTRSAIVYRPGVVTPFGPWAFLDSSVDPRFIDRGNQPTLAQTFTAVTGGRFTLAVNRFRSKASSCDLFGDPDTGDGQGNCNLVRTDAARAVVDWLATDPTGAGDARFLVVGNLNAYAQEDPISVFRSADYMDLIDQFVGDDAYSFVANGQSGYLDHALASIDLAGQVTGVAIFHINADEPSVLDYNTEFKTPNHVNTLYDEGPFRAADHDPVLIGLDLSNDQPVARCANVTVSTPPNACTATASIDNGSFDPDGGPITVVQSPSTPVGPGTSIATLTVTDSHGATATCTATITVIDDVSPAIACPAPQVIECTSPAGATASIAATSSDNCAATSASCSPGPFALGLTPVSCSAFDASGNSASCSTSVQVVDTTPPAVSCERNAGNFYRVTATDVCTAAPTVRLGSYVIANGETIKITRAPRQPGVTLVNTMELAGIRHFRVGAEDAVLTATDGAGNTKTVSCLTPK